MTHHNQAQLFARAAEFASRTALIDLNGQYTYQQLLDASAGAATGLLAGADDLQEDRVAFLVPSGFDYVATQWASGGRAGSPCRWPSLIPDPNLSTS